MEDSPRVSVVVPTFQRRELVTRAVASALGQTYRDLELIVVDDGSTDGTAEALAPLDGRIRYLWQENRGTAAARNAGLGIARGELVAFLDSDDRWLPQHLDVLVGTLDGHPTAVLACTCPGFLARGRAEPTEARVIDPLPKLLVANDVGYVSCVGVRRSSLDGIGGFNEGLEPAEYTDLVVRLAFHGPFALVRRRTVVLQATRGSMLDRGRNSGRYLRNLAEIARRTAVEARGGRHGVAAEGAHRFFAALEALAAGKRDEARVALAEACRLFPELSSEPLLVGRQLRNALPAAGGGPDRLTAIATIAELWPDPRSDTAKALRAYVLARALRSGRVRVAARALRSLRPADAVLVVRRRSEMRGVVRRTLSSLFNRGSEPSRLDGRPPS